MNKGFTLVELSIVLVIIGLLIGGILVGQSLIESAKINKAVGQIQQYDVAVQQFKTKYKQLPGDNNIFPPNNTQAKKNNGFIEEGIIACCGYTATWEFGYENKNFWPHLQANGLKIPGIANQLDMDNTIITGLRVSGSDQNIPKFELGENTGIIASTTTIDRAAGTSPFCSGCMVLEQPIKAGNYYFIADFSAITNHALYNAGAAKWEESIPVASSLSIDQKMDDGLADSGTVLNRSYQTGINCVAATTSSTYKAEVADGKCALAIRMNY